MPVSSSLSYILGKVELRILFSLYHNIYPFLDVDRVGIFNKFEDIISPFVIFSYFSSYILWVNCIPFVTGTMHICMVTFFGLYLQKYAPMKKKLDYEDERLVSLEISAIHLVLSPWSWIGWPIRIVCFFSHKQHLITVFNVKIP